MQTDNKSFYFELEALFIVGCTAAFLMLCYLYIYFYNDFRFENLFKDVLSSIPAIEKPVSYLESRDAERAILVKNVYSFHWLIFICAVVIYGPIFAVISKRMLQKNESLDLSLSKRLEFKNLKNSLYISSNLFFVFAAFCFWDAFIGGLMIENYTFFNNAVHVRDRDLMHLAIAMGGFIFFFSFAVYQKVLIRIFKAI